jgi:hypothetical protein
MKRRVTRKRLRLSTTGLRNLRNRRKKLTKPLEG